MKVRFGLAALFAAVVLLAVVLMVPETSSADGAVVIKNGGCFVYNTVPGFVYGRADQAVTTASGGTKFTCKATVTPPNGGAVRYNAANKGGAWCWTDKGPTLDWQETVSASGHATLQCTVHSNAANRATRLRR